jgi:NADPH:quinone reductase-like Zn-dependent oxidoreductase
MTTPQVRAWTYTQSGYPSTLTLSTLPAPSSEPQPHHLLIQIHACALNPVDIQLMNLPIWSLPKMSYPKTPGADFSGTVLAAGPLCTYSAGDEILGFSLGKSTNGFLAETVDVNEEHACIVKKPSAWSWVQAAALPLVWLTARTCVEMCGGYVTKEGNAKVVVLGGSSGVGMYVCYLARERGWEVLATCSGKNAEFVKGMGADVVVDYTAQDVVGEVKKYAPAAIIDCVGGTDCIGIAPQYISIVGDKTSRSTMGGSALYWTRPMMMLRYYLGKFGLGKSYHCIVLDAKKEYLEEALRLPTDKIIIDSTFDFGRGKEAYERLDTARARGKVVVQIKQSS